MMRFRLPPGRHYLHLCTPYRRRPGWLGQLVPLASTVRPARQPGADQVNAKKRSHRQGTARTMVPAAATSQHRVNATS